MNQLSPREEVRVGRCGQYFVIEPQLPELCDTFYTVRHDCVEDLEHGCRIVRPKFPLVWEQTDLAGTPVSVCFAGLEPLVTAYLQRRRLPVQMAGEKTGPLSLAARCYADVLGDPDDALLSLVKTHDRGMIRYDREHVDPARLVAQIALAWPRASLVIPVTQMDDAWRFRSRLAKYIPRYEITVHTHRNNPPRAGRVVVGTYSMLGGGQIELENRNILIAPNSDEMLTHEDGRNVIRFARAARFYGLMPFDQKLRRFHRDYLRSLLGPYEVIIPRHGKVLRNVDVAFCPIYGGPRLPRDVDLVNLLRLGIWEHDLRNRRIAALATALERKDSARLERSFAHTLPRAPKAWHGRIGVLVATVKHALVLSRRLPGWPVITAGEFLQDGLSADERALLAQSQSIPAERSRAVIVTSEGLATAGCFGILVRADAGVGLPADGQLCSTETYWTSPMRSSSPRDLLLIDFLDDHHRSLRERSRQRRATYIEAGWNLGTERPDALDLYLAKRPEVDIP